MRIWARVAAAGVVLLLVGPVFPAPAEAARRCGGKKVTIQGSHRSDRIRGTKHQDVINARGGDDRIWGGGGNDIICGGPGRDDIRGERGHDRLYGGRDGITVDEFGWTIKDGDVLRGGPGNDTLVPGPDTRRTNDVRVDTISYDYAPRGVSVNLDRGRARGQGRDRLVIQGPVALVGSRFGDTLVGSKYDDRIDAFTGADRVYGLGGNDRIWLDGFLRISGSGDADYADGGPGDDTIEARQGADRLVGGPGNDSLRDDGDRGNDLLVGGDGNDMLIDTGGNGADRLDGGAGDDWVQVTLAEGSPTLLGGPGNDALSVISAAAGNPAAELDIPGQRFRIMATTSVTGVLSGFEAYRYSGGGWRVLGSAAVDLVDAVEAASVDMVGDAGDDTLRGSYGSSTFDGGAGSDCFQRPSGGSGAESLLGVEQTRLATDPCPWLTGAAAHTAGHPPQARMMNRPLARR